MCAPWVPCAAVSLAIISESVELSETDSVPVGDGLNPIASFDDGPGAGAVAFAVAVAESVSAVGEPGAGIASVVCIDVDDGAGSTCSSAEAGKGETKDPHTRAEVKRAAPNTCPPKEVTAPVRAPKTLLRLMFCSGRQRVDPHTSQYLETLLTCHFGRWRPSSRSSSIFMTSPM